MTNLGLYAHFPFCKRKCRYCDFNSRVGSDDERKTYLRALHAEIAAQAANPLATIYFGGGTPTLYAPRDLIAVLAAVMAKCDLAPDAEITLEANPGTIAEPGLRELRAAGFNRISIGVQSLRDDELQMLGRIHSADEAKTAVAHARAAGFDNLSVDVIRGLPGQRLQHWRETLEGVVALAPQHVSVYGLSLEEGTPLRASVERGDLPAPNEDDAPAWIRWTIERLATAGYRRYEISNYARPGFECRHNLNYWRRGEYLGLGAGASSYLDGVRTRNIPGPAAYAAASLAEENLTEDSERLGSEAALAEAVMLGLRTTEGISPECLMDRFGIDILHRHAALIAGLTAAGMMNQDADRLSLTPEGMLVQSAIAVQFLP